MMKKSHSSTLIVALGLLLVGMSSCASIMAQFSGAYDPYEKGMKTWGRKEAAVTLKYMAQSLSVDAKYTDPINFLVKNYAEISAKAAEDLKANTESTFDLVVEKARMYDDLIYFYSKVSDGTVVNPLGSGKQTLTIEIVDYATPRKTLADKGIKLGIAEGKAEITANKIDDANSTFDNMLQLFYEKDDREKASDVVSSFYLAEVKRLLGLKTTDAVAVAEKVMSGAKRFARSDDAKAVVAKAQSDMDAAKANIYLAEINALKKKGDIQSLIAANKLYTSVIKLLPDQAEKLAQDQLALKNQIAELINRDILAAEKNFNGTDEMYDSILASYKSLESWVPDYKDSKNRLAAFTDRVKMNLIVFGTDYLSNDLKLKQTLASTIKTVFGSSKIFSVEAVGSDTGASDVPSAIEEAKARGFKFVAVILPPTAKNPMPKTQVTTKQNEEPFVLFKNGQIATTGDDLLLKDSDGMERPMTVAQLGMMLATANALDKVIIPPAMYDVQKEKKNLKEYMESINVVKYWFKPAGTITTTGYFFEGTYSVTVVVYRTSDGKKLLEKPFSNVVATGIGSQNKQVAWSFTDSALGSWAKTKNAGSTYEMPDVQAWVDAAYKAIQGVMRREDLAKDIAGSLKN